MAILVLLVGTRSWISYLNLFGKAPQYQGAKIITNVGEFEIRFNTRTPIAVYKFIERVKSKYYIGTRFHRVVPELLVEGGDPLSRELGNISKWGDGGGEAMFVDEIVPEYKMTRGAVAMANRGPNTNGSQFFVVVADEVEWLDGKHTVWGYVESGMDVVEKMSKVAVGVTGVPREELKIVDILLQ